MLITHLSFAEFYERFNELRPGAKYQVIVSFVARYADAKKHYSEIIEDWSSFYDLGGSKIAFVFAGTLESKAEKETQYAKRHQGGFTKIPEGLMIAGQDNFNLEIMSEDEKSISRAYHPPEKNEFQNNHSLRIKELKKVLNINEIDIPCIHFYYTHSKKSQIISLATLGEPLYHFFKKVINDWDKIFLEIDEEQEKQQAIYEKQRLRAEDRNRHSGGARAQLTKMNQLISALKDPPFKTEAQSLLKTVLQIPTNIDAKKAAFSRLKELGSIYPNVDKNIFFQFNSMIDLVDRLSPKVEMPDLPHTKLDYGAYDIKLMNLLSKISSTKNTIEENELNQNKKISKLKPPLKVFISYSMFDGESSSDGVNYLGEFKDHLTPLSLYSNLIQTWDDTLLIPGEKLNDRLLTELNSADIIFLLISHNFLATKYIQEFQLSKAIDRHLKQECIVVPIIIRPCLWDAVPILKKLSGIPRNGIPVSSWKRNPLWADRNDVWVHILDEIKRMLDSLV